MCNHEPRHGSPPTGPPGVALLCVYSASAWLGDLLGVSRSMDREFLSVLSCLILGFPERVYCTVCLLSGISYCVTVF